jgi:hypothetical protein
MLERGGGPVKFYTEMELRAPNGAIDDARFDALADALYELDDSDPDVTDADLTARLTEGRVTASMVIEAGDPAAAATKALCAVRTAIHTIGDATPGWETATGVMRIAPADEADRLFASA